MKRTTGKFLSIFTLLNLAICTSLVGAPASFSRGGGHGGMSHGGFDHAGMGHDGLGHGACGHECADRDGFGRDGDFGRGLGNHFGIGDRDALGARLPVNHGYFSHAPYRYGWGATPAYGAYGLGYSYYPNNFFPTYYADGVAMGEQNASANNSDSN